MSLEKIDALEDRISKVVELVKNLKEERTRLEEQLIAEMDAKKAVDEELARLKQEKEQVRVRLENLLNGIENLTS